MGAASKAQAIPYDYPDDKPTQKEGTYRKVGGANIDVPDDYQVSSEGGNVYIEKVEDYVSRKFNEMNQHLDLSIKKLEQRITMLENEIKLLSNKPAETSIQTDSEPAASEASSEVK